MNYQPYNHLDYLQGDFTAYVNIDGKPAKVEQITFIRPLEAESLVIIFGLVPDHTRPERFCIGHWNKQGQPITNTGPFITHDKNYNLLMKPNEKATY